MLFACYVSGGRCGFRIAVADFAASAVNVKRSESVKRSNRSNRRNPTTQKKVPHQGGGSATWRKCGVRRRKAQIIEGCPDRYSPHHLDAPSSLLLRNETHADPMRRNAALFIECVDRRRSSSIDAPLTRKYVSRTHYHICHNTTVCHGTTIGVKSLVQHVHDM